MAGVIPRGSLQSPSRLPWAVPSSSDLVAVAHGDDQYSIYAVPRRTYGHGVGAPVLRELTNMVFPRWPTITAPRAKPRRRQLGDAGHVPESRPGQGVLPRRPAGGGCCAQGVGGLRNTPSRLGDEHRHSDRRDDRQICRSRPDGAMRATVSKRARISRPAALLDGGWSRASDDAQLKVNRVGSNWSLVGNVKARCGVIS